MGFFDTYKDEGSGNYIGKDERQTLIANEVPLEIVKIYETQHSEYGPKYNVVVNLEGEERTISWKKADENGGVYSRDRMLVAMQEYLESKGDDDPLPRVVIYRVKQAQLLRDADATTE